MHSLLLSRLRGAEAGNALLPRCVPGLTGNRWLYGRHDGAESRRCLSSRRGTWHTAAYDHFPEGARPESLTDLSAHAAPPGRPHFLKIVSGIADESRRQQGFSPVHGTGLMKDAPSLMYRAPSK